MSTDVDGERDLAAELDDGAAGQRGIPVDAICTGCKQVKVKRAPIPDGFERDEFDPDDLEDANPLEDSITSFTHVCHRCGTCTWWNAVSLLRGLLRSELAGDEDGDGGGA